MTSLNETFLQHEGSTDVITFDYIGAAVARPRKTKTGTCGGPPALRAWRNFHLRGRGGVQARNSGPTGSRKSSVTSSTASCICWAMTIRKPDPRRKMKREENRRLRELSRRFSLAQLGRAVKLSAVRKSLFARWRASFFTGLAVVLPGVITLAVVKWLFGTISSFTDLLLFFLPQKFDSRERQAPARCSGIGACWRCCWRSSSVGSSACLTRYYIGKRMIALADSLMLRVPVLNKIYGTIKQVDEAFIPAKKARSRPSCWSNIRATGIYSVGFITSEQRGRDRDKDRQKMRVHLHSDDADSHGRLSDRRAGGKSHQARHVRGRRLQIHHQHRRAFE